MALQRLLQDKPRVVWPAAYDAQNDGRPIDPADVELLVLPLDRIGAPPGASGASVYIVYYSHAPRDAGADQWIVSPPLAVKIGDAAKLKDELDVKKRWPSLGEAGRQRFAFPFHLDAESAENGVLVAPFRSKFVDEAGERNRIQLGDLWGLLTDSAETLTGRIPCLDEVRACVHGALEAVALAHRGNAKRKPRRSRTYASAFEWYLRGTCAAMPGASRAHIPDALFGAGDQVNAFGRVWPNPRRIMEDLVKSARTFETYFGPIHGDLHSKNIVIDNRGQVHIIDFGWAVKEAPIVLDFLLLDINLRGTTLPSQVSEPDLLALAGFLSPTQEVDDLPVPVRCRAALIKDCVWSAAKVEAAEDWFSEYLIPMFIVSFGLLVHLDSARNQNAIIALILSLADEIERSKI